MPATKFEWRPLTLTPVNFSLTEGTLIPAPPDSPPATPHPSKSSQGPLSSHPTPAFLEQKEAELASKGRTSDTTGPASPTSPTLRRPNSVRRLWGLRSMSSDSLTSERPASPATMSSQTSLPRSKSNSWFGGRKKAFSIAVGTVPESKENTQTAAAQQRKPAGRPPPALPELKTLGVNDDSLRLGADDMFKNM